MLADVFEKFRCSRLKDFELCSSHYLIVLALGWDAMLNVTKVQLGLILDGDMFLFFEKGKEAEFLTFLRDIVNPTIGMSNLIMYLETNNSYDYAISKFLLTGRFKL